MENQNENMSQQSAAQQPIAQAAPQQPVETEAVSSGGKGKKIILIVIILLIVILGVGGWWYYAKGQVMMLHNQMVWDWGNNLANFKTETSFAISINKSGTTSVDKIMPLGEQVVITGESSQHTVGSNSSGQGSYSLDAGDTFQLYLDLLYRKIGESFYVKPTLKGGEELGLFSSDVDLGDSWLELKISDAAMFNPLMVSSDDEYQKQLKELNTHNAELLQRVKKVGAFEISDPHQTKASSDGKLRKIQYKIKANKLADLIIVLSEHFDNYADMPYSDLEEYGEPSSMKEKFLLWQQENPDEWNNMKTVLSNINIYLWVNTNNKNVQGIELSARNLLLPNNPGPETILSFSFSNMLYSAEPIDIKKPDSVLTLEEALAVIAGKAMGVEMDDEVIRALSDETDTDGDGLPDNVETMIFETDPNNPDTDGDGYDDGIEIDNGYNPLGEGLLDQAYYEAKMQQLMGGTSASSELLTEYETLCVSTGGQWYDQDCFCSDGMSFGVDGCSYNNETFNNSNMLDTGGDPEALCTTTGGDWYDQDCACPQGMSFGVDGCETAREMINNFDNWQTDTNIGESLCVSTGGQWYDQDCFCSDGMSFDPSVGCN